MELLTYLEIKKAYDRIKSKVLKTPLIYNETVNRLFKANIFFKLENLQITGSFKLRGASNVISQLSEKERSNGVVAFSSGNHAQAVSYVSKLENISSKIVMPKNAPQIKINNTIKFGSEIVLYDPLKQSREEIAKKISSKENKKIIKPYDDLQTIAGQGTAGLEIVEDLKKNNIKPDIYLCCCGGGGLIAGTSIYLKKFFPNLKIYSAEPENYNDTQLSLLRNKIIENKQSANSICDSLLAKKPGEITFSINKKILEAGLSVTEEEVKKAIIYLAENLKVVVEPGGAVAAATLLNNKLNFKNKNIVVMISGGNIDYSLFSNLVNCK